MFDKIKLNHKDVDQKTSKARRIENVLAFSNLERSGLEHNKYERQVLLYETKHREKLFIQFPGKESIGILKEARPWDFRPKLMNSEGTFMKDLSFKDIWDDIVALKNIANESLSLLAAIFYRLSMMIDVENTNETYEFYEVDIDADISVKSGTIDLSWNKLKFDEEIIDYLHEQLGCIRGFSIEAYIYYNDLLCQNEDCKYYYRDVKVNSKDWDGSIGRKNTYWTHMSIIGYLQGNIRFTRLIDKFQSGRGVAPIAIKDIPNVTGNIISV